MYQVGVRSGLQHPLAAADDCQKGPWPFVVPVAGETFGVNVAEIARILLPQSTTKLRSALGDGLKRILQGRLSSRKVA